MAVNKIVVKKVVVGTPIRRVTAGAFALSNLGGVTIGGESDGSVLAFQTSSGNYVTTKLKGQENIRAVYDSSSSRYTFSFRGDSYLGDFIPAADSAQSLGSPNFKWKDLYLSGGTVHLGGLQLKDSGGSFTVIDSATGTTLLTNPKFLNIRGNANILTYDSATSTFTFDDSDMARTNVAETFHQGLTILNGLTLDSGTVTGDFNIGGNLNVTGDLVYDDMTADSATFVGTVTVGTNVTSPLGRIAQFTSDSASITTITNTNLTGSQATFDSADVGTLRVTGNTTIGGNLNVTGDLTFDDLSADSATFSGNLAVGNNITSANAKIDSATIPNIDGTNLTYTNITNTNLTGSQATFDSVNITTLNATNLTFSSASVTDLTADSAKIGGIDLTGNNLTTTGKLFFANVFNNEVDLPSATTYHGMFAHVHATGRGYFAHAGAWHKLIDSDTTDVQQVYTLKSNFADIDSATIDSATITTLTNTNLISSQATFDSANVASLGKVASVDATTTSTIRGLFSVSGDLTYNSGTGQFSIDVEDIYTKANFDSDLGDANTGQLPEGSNLYYTSARADSDAKNAVSVTDAGGDGSLAYNSTTGVFTYTGPSAAEVRAHLTANKGLSVSSGEFNIDSSNVKGMFSATDAGGDGSFAYNSGTGVFTYTGPSASEVRAHLTANKGLSVTSGEFNLDSSNVKGMFSGDKGLTYNASTGEFNVDSANVRGIFTANKGLSVSSGEFNIDSANVKGMLQAGTGVTFDSSNGLISIGQPVGTGDSVHFNNLVLSGNLTVNGSTVTNNATNTTISDALIELGSGNTGANTNDLGLILERGTTGDNVFIGWDETADRVVFGTTTATAASTGDLTFTNADIQAANLFGNASTATALASGRNFELTGQITAAAVSFDGTGNVTLVTDIAAGAIRDSDINAAAAIADTKLATISTAGKVSNSATTATDANTNSAIVARDGSGNFSAGTVTLTDLHVGNLHVDSADIIKISRDNLVGGTGITYDSATGAISTTDGDIVHDNLSGFVANEHIDHTSVSMIAGNGLSGGGTIAADRTFNIDSANVRGIFTANKGLSVSSGEFNIDSANVRGMFSASGLSYNSGTGQFSVSATQVMDLIKTVDSNGSGLNAATLDGQEGSHYRIDVFDASGTLLN